MKIKSIKKLLVILMTAVMVLGMSIATYAVSGSNSGVTTVTDEADTELSIKKTIRMENAEAGQYFQPDITYTYSVAPATPPEGATVSDGTGSIIVDPGVADGVTIKTTAADNTVSYASTGSVIFSKSDTYTTAHEGAAGIQYILVDKTLDLHVDLSKFTTPGVYRYKITDTTTSETLEEAGIVRKAAADGFSEGAKFADTERYLDVFIENGTSGLKVSGYVLTATNNSQTTANTKTEGFTNTDFYRTYNIRITKKTTGALADKTHEFPFTVAIDNKDGSNESTQHNYYVYKNTGSSVSSAEETQDIKLKHDDTYYIRGLTPFATVGYTETNDTNDTYVVTANGFKTTGNENDKNTFINAEKINGSGTKSITASAVTNYTSRQDKTSEAETTYMRSVIWENKLDSVSPTGIVRRFLPYVAMAVVAVVLIASIVISRKRSEELDEA